MSREFYPGAFMHIADLQPHLAPFHYNLAQTSPAAAAPAPYKVTAEDAGAGAGEAAAGAGAGLPTHHEQPKRRDSHFSEGFEGTSVPRPRPGPACEGFDAAGMPACEGYDGAGLPACDALSVAGSSSGSVAAPASRKRKAGSSFSANSATSAFEEEEDARSVRTMPDRRQNHSEIEKRRRDKMNTYITELSSLVPMCGAMARKLDKLTVLRLAVQHLRGVRGRAAAPLPARPRPALLADRDLNALVLAAARQAFLLVLGADRGRLLYVSASVADTLHYHQSELVGQSLFDILHPKDVGKVKEQLSSSDLNPRERLIDAKTMLPVKSVGAAASRLGPGGRRSFFCRIKCKSPAGAGAAPHSLTSPPLKEELDPPTNIRKKQHAEKKYCVVQCTGFLKSWSASELCGAAGEGASAGAAGAGACEEEEGSVPCLVAVCRALPAPAPAPAPASAPAPARRLQFHSRHAIDGKYVFVDQRVTLALGFLPQELLGTSLYEVVCARALGAVARAHKAALAPPALAPPALTPPYAARRKDGSHALLTTHFKPFRNPWTKEVECLMARNTLVAEAPRDAYDPHHLGSGVCYESVSESGGEGLASSAGSEGDAEMQRLIESQVEAHKIGSAIAEEALRRSPANTAAASAAAAAAAASAAVFSPETPQEALLQEAFFNQVLVDNILAPEPSCQVRNNVPLSSTSVRSPHDGKGEGEGGESPLSEDSPLALDGNNEAAMAVIMSLLEADAGLGGLVNYSGLPWPLP